MRFGKQTWDHARFLAWCLGAAGTFLIVGGLAWWVAERTRPAGVDQARAELRGKNLAELRADNAVALTSYGWIDPAKGMVRLPVQRALELSLQMGQDPTSARAELLSRLDRATAKPPEQPGEYE